MNDRDIIARELDQVEQRMKELEIRYEQYFAGVEKREPFQEREELARRLRRYANRRINQTDLRFRCQNLATRFHSYSGHWDRILRLIDEGRYVRHTTRVRAQAPSPPPSETGDEADVIYRELLEARTTCNIEGKEPSRKQVAAFLERQNDKIRERFGDRAVEFQVVTDGGTPRIRVRAKR